jgi:acyl-CoA reductase-like NAD-dependent aldehyde dehydrogenase
MVTTIRARWPYYLANQAVFANESLEITDKYTQAPVARVALADDAAIDAAIGAATDAAGAMRRVRPDERRDILLHCVERFTERFEELAFHLCVEAGKPIRDARGEVTRLIDTFREAAGEATRIHGEVMNLEISPRARGTRGFTTRVPVGPVSLISPFNFPLNLAAHKVAPAIAAGCPWILKPASRTPLGALLIAEVLAETSLPKGAFSVLPTPGAGAQRLVVDPRLKLLSFTGSPAVGWDLKAKAGAKKVLLELGGNAACVVDGDQGPRLPFVVERLVFGGFYQSGQSCISVQRIFVHESLYEALRERLVTAVRALKAGDPKAEDTFVGPIIDEGEAARIHGWIASARARGARVLCGGGRDGGMVEPTVLEDVPADEPAVAEEMFGPVVALFRFSRFEDALAQVNASKYGLQAGVFTDSLAHTLEAWDELEVGGVVVGDVPSFRVDNMPYGGVKGSGLGREGIRWSIEEMTEPRLLVVR